MPSVNPPRPSQLYHGAYTANKDGIGDDITPADLKSYTDKIGKGLAWVNLPNEWSHSRFFPADQARWIRQAGAVPCIRLMLRSSMDDAVMYPERLYTLDNLVDGKFDDDLKLWGRDAKQFAAPLLVEYGSEVNISKFCWNGWHNGMDKGPAKFKAAYRHIVEVMKKEGADNISWVFHINADDLLPNGKEADWNKFEEYYPGNDVVDWVGVSCYGVQIPNALYDEPPFEDHFGAVYERLQQCDARGNPVLVAEIGCVDRQGGQTAEY